MGSLDVIRKKIRDREKQPKGVPVLPALLPRFPILQESKRRLMRLLDARPLASRYVDRFQLSEEQPEEEPILDERDYVV